MAIIIEYLPSKFVGKIELITYMGFPDDTMVNNPPANAGDIIEAWF